MYKIREITTGKFLIKPFVGKFAEEGYIFDHLENAIERKETLVKYRHMSPSNLEIVQFNLNEVGVVKS